MRYLRFTIAACGITVAILAVMFPACYYSDSAYGAWWIWIFNALQDKGSGPGHIVIDWQTTAVNAGFPVLLCATLYSCTYRRRRAVLVQAIWLGLSTCFAIYLLVLTPLFLSVAILIMDVCLVVSLFMSLIMSLYD